MHACAPLLLLRPARPGPAAGGCAVLLRRQRPSSAPPAAAARADAGAAAAAPAASSAAAAEEPVAVAHRESPEGGASARSPASPAVPPAASAPTSWPSLFPRLLHPFELACTPHMVGADLLLHELEAEVAAHVAGAEERADVHSKIWAAFDVLETPGQYELAADLPGVAAADVGVTVCAGVVELSGERSRKPAPPGGVYKRLERSYGTLKRRFKLPPDGDADGVTASLEHGVLHIMVPRKPAPGGAEPPRRVSVRDREGRGWLA